MNHFENARIMAKYYVSLRFQLSFFVVVTVYLAFNHAGSFPQNINEYLHSEASCCGFPGLCPCPPTHTPGGGGAGCGDPGKVFSSLADNPGCC